MRIVSVTSLSADLDSRSYRAAASFTRMGHESIMVEGQGSVALPRGVAFELISAGEPRPRILARSAVPGAQVESPAQDPWRPVRLIPLRIRRLPRLVWGRLMTVFSARTATARVLVRRLRDNLKIYRSLPPADLYYLNGDALFPAVGLASLVRRAPFVYDAQDSYYESFDGLARRELPPAIGVLRALERVCVRRSAEFVTSSDGIVELLAARHGRVPISIMNHHDRRLDESVANDLRSQLRLQGDAVLCVVIGNAKPGTCGEQALRALAELPERFHLAFIGQKQGAYRRLIEELGLGSRAHLLEAVPHTQIAAYVRRADASAILHQPLDANYSEHVPCRLFHAIAAGLPLVYAPQPGMESIVRPYRLGISVDPLDPASVAAGLQRVAEPSMQRRLRANVARTRDELSWEREEHLLANLISSTRVNGRRRPALTPDRKDLPR